MPKHSLGKRLTEDIDKFIIAAFDSHKGPEDVEKAVVVDWEEPMVTFMFGVKNGSPCPCCVPKPTAMSEELWRAYLLGG